MRAMAVDLGDARSGVALSDPTGFIAGDAFVIEESDISLLAEKLAGLARERGAGVIIVGCPRNMDGSEGARADKCREAAALIGERSGLPVELFDERLTTVQAYAILREGGKKARKAKKTVDAVAASLILQGWLDSRRL